MKCAIHPDSMASGSCVNCGKLHCENCLVDVSGRYFCKNCLKSGKASIGEKDRPPIIINTTANSSSDSTSGAASLASAKANSIANTQLSANQIAACCCCIIMIMAL